MTKQAIKKPYKPERDYLSEMVSAKYYNEKRIKGYNHFTGLVDKTPPIRPVHELIKSINLKMINNYD